MLAAPAAFNLPDCGRLSCRDGDGKFYLIGPLVGVVFGGAIGGVIGYFDVGHEGWRRVELSASLALGPRPHR